jgi:hypothetical protein
MFEVQVDLQFAQPRVLPSERSLSHWLALKSDVHRLGAGLMSKYVISFFIQHSALHKVL